jgi:hypothetical protein
MFSAFSKNSIILLSITMLLISGCATHKVQYGKTVDKNNFNFITDSTELIHKLYLIGDAGFADENNNLTHFNLLKQELKSVSNNSTVLFLGDNIYENGMPSEEDSSRKLAEHRINAQLNLVENTEVNTIFIPGNHDYYSNGIKGLKRQQEYIANKLNNKNAFLPKNGCPIETVNFAENAILIIVDSQWYLENWNNNPTMNDDCEIKSRKQFFMEFESILKKNISKTIVVAIHHPLFSNGPHGGQFSTKKQLYPIHNKLPLPGIGSFINLLRKTSGASPQDLNNKLYLELKNRLITLSQKPERIVFVSGHEHNLQYIFKENIAQIISGSGSKKSEGRAINGGLFSYGNLGYATLEFYKSGVTIASFFTEKNNEKNLLFKTKVLPANEIYLNKTFNNDFPKTVKASIYSEKEVDKSLIFKALWGNHYRKYYGTKITAQTVLLDTLYGGLKPIRFGGGNQSRSLRLTDNDGKEYVMRALRKSATQYIQAVAYKTHYVAGQFDNTLAESLLMDIYTTAHPYAPFAVNKLANAISINHTNPKLYFVPKQQALGNFNENFGDELYMIEPRATDGHGNLKHFGYSNKLISTDDLLKKLRKTDDNKVDTNNYIRARLFDMLIGDWDRHEDQWRWAEYKEDNKTIYKPVPRDRDQAFSSNDGFILGFLTRAIAALKLMQTYTGEMRSVKWFNLEPYPLDVALLNQTTLENWKNEALFIQNNLTDETINSAFNQLPNEINDETITQIKQIVKIRRNTINKIAEEYYKHLQKFAVITGTDKDNYFEIERKTNGETAIKIYNIKNNEKGSLIFEKSFFKNETKEIWVFGLDDTDTFKISGNETNLIPIRLIGGQNNDTYIIENGKKVTVYDYKSKQNTFANNKAKIKLTDNYETNTYNHKVLKHNSLQILPSVGSNPDDGFRIGVKSLYTIYGFEKNPFTQQHNINAAYYFANKGFDILYDAEFANIISNWNFRLETQFTSPNFSINHFGFGNETKNFEKFFNEDYHRVKLSKIAVSPSILKRGIFNSNLKFGAIFESIEVENTKDRFINTLPYTLEIRKNYIGAKAKYAYENYDNILFPTLGMQFNLETGWKTNVNNAKENHLYITPSIGFTHNIDTNRKFVLATKFKGNIIIGDTFEFYHAAHIGGLEGIRGYRNQRFAGDKSYYQNTDIRLNLSKIKTAIVPVQIGIYGGFDYGRVWQKNETSNDWKTASGGGIWLIAADLVNFNLSAFNSEEGTYVKFSLGFGF